jgi:hypothetical protein
MRIDRRLVGIGVFLITIGAVMVAIRQGLLSDDAVARAWDLWPLILVGAGLSIILAGRPGAVVGTLVLAITFGTMVGAVAATGSFPRSGLCGGSPGQGRAFAPSGGDLGSGGRVTISQDCGDLTLGTVAGSTWSVSGESRDGRGPGIRSDAGLLRISGPDGGAFDLGGTILWNVVLPRDPSLDLEIDVNGGQSRVALAGAHVGSLRVETNAGSIDVDLRDVTALADGSIDVNFGSATIRLPDQSVTASLSVNAGSAALCLPSGAGLRVSLKSAAASNDLGAHGLIQSGDTWETPGYATAPVRIDLRADVNAGSLVLDPQRQCAG